MDGESTLTPPQPGCTPSARERPRVYGAQLDASMCPDCAARAGIEYQSDDPSAPGIPNPQCTSDLGCRCGWI